MPQDSNASKLPLILWSVAALVVVGAVIMGFLVTGGPQLQRVKSMDDRRVSDLGRLSNDIQAYLNREQKLPEHLKALKDGEGKLLPLPRDPVSGDDYAYQKKDETHFALCAVFQLDNHPENPNDAGRCINCDLHPKGKYCYQYKVRATGTGTDRYFSADRE